MDDTRDGLTVGPTIRERIESAIQDEYPFHVIYCKRLEGTTTTIIDIASKDKGIKVAGHRVLQRNYTDQGVSWFSPDSNIYGQLDGSGCHTIILDVVPDRVAHKVRVALSRMPIKVIVIKNVLRDESGR